MPMLFQRTETENKEPASIRPPSEKHVSIPWQLYAFGSVFMFLLWIFIYFYTKHQCDIYYEMCFESTVVFWAFPIGIVLTGSVWNAVFLLRAYHVAQKERLVSAIDHHFDYRNCKLLRSRHLQIFRQLIKFLLNRISQFVGCENFIFDIGYLNSCPNDVMM